MLFSFTLEFVDIHLFFFIVLCLATSTVSYSLVHLFGNEVLGFQLTVTWLTVLLKRNSWSSQPVVFLSPQQLFLTDGDFHFCVFSPVNHFTQWLSQNMSLKCTNVLITNLTPQGLLSLGIVTFVGSIYAFFKADGNIVKSFLDEIILC